MPGRGSAEQYVRERFPAEVALYLSRVKKRRSALVAVIDADTKSTTERDREIWRALKSAGQPARKPTDAIALFIPKRHIESWILCLTGDKVNETSDYSKRDDIQARIRLAAEHFFDWSRSGYKTPDCCIPSLHRAFPEFRRI